MKDERQKDKKRKKKGRESQKEIMICYSADMDPCFTSTLNSTFDNFNFGPFRLQY